GIGLVDDGRSVPRRTIAPLLGCIAAAERAGGELGGRLTVCRDACKRDAGRDSLVFLDALGEIPERRAAEVAPAKAELVYQVRSECVGIADVGPMARNH